MAKRRIILASSSPRRKQLLEQIGIKAEVHESSYEEDMQAMDDPYELAKFLALNKAKDVAEHYDDAIVIGADTFIVIADEFLGKPGSIDKAREMLGKISGEKIKIITGYAVIDTRSKIIENDYSEAIAFVKNLDNDEIEDYLETGEPIDRAGAYVAQEIGAAFTERIEGDFTAIVGLPLNKIYCALKSLDVNIFKQ